IAYDVSEQLVITDVFLLCSAANDRQIRAIVDEIEEKMRQAGARPVRREGERERRWVLLDYLDIVIHVQLAEERIYYALERLWKHCPRVPLPEPVEWCPAGPLPPGGLTGTSNSCFAKGPGRLHRGRRVPVVGHDATGRASSGASGARVVPGPGDPPTAAVAGARSAGAQSAEASARNYDHSVRLVLWRHGQTRWDVEGRFQGQSDISLDPVGEQRAARAARLLAALQPSAIYSSDLIRATATAAPLARLTGLTVISDKDLRERYGGLWEGLTDTEIRARYPVEHSQWRPPEGETSVAV